MTATLRHLGTTLFDIEMTVRLRPKRVFGIKRNGRSTSAKYAPAGLNRQYFVPCQFKRTRHFVDSLTMAPDDLANRLDRVFLVDAAAGISQIEQLVQETIALVNAHMPDVDTSVLRHPPGQRQQPWQRISVDRLDLVPPG